MSPLNENQLLPENTEVATKLQKLAEEENVNLEGKLVAKNTADTFKGVRVSWRKFCTKRLCYRFKQGKNRITSHRRKERKTDRETGDRHKAGIAQK